MAERRDIKQEHRIWKFNTLVLYDLILSHTLEWPSLTVEWLPGINPKKDGLVGQNLLIGTHTANNEPNYIIILEVGLPLTPINPSGMRYDQQADYSGFAYGDISIRKFNINARIPHEGEINRASSNPFDSKIIATMSNSGSIYLFDTTKFGPLPPKNMKNLMMPLAKLKGHIAEGWGLVWNSNNNEGQIASAADDGCLCVWNINRSPKKGEIQPLSSFSYSKSPIQDVVWKCDAASNECICVNDEGYMLIWDIREASKNIPSQKCKVSNSPVISTSCNSYHSEIVATGGADYNINIWDIRNLKRSVHRMLSHEESIVRLKWASFKSSLLAAASSDRFVTLWDLDRVGMEQTSDDAEDGPPELIFTHGGHTAPVSDICWNPDESFPWMMASVSEDNMLEIWQPSKKAFQQQEIDDEVLSEYETEVE